MHERRSTEVPDNNLNWGPTMRPLQIFRISSFLTFRYPGLLHLFCNMIGKQFLSRGIHKTYKVKHMSDDVKTNIMYVVITKKGRNGN